jgi:acid phosphatase
MKRTLVIVTFDESEGNNKPERIYTVFLGSMVKPQEVTAPYNHYSVLRTIEDNFGLDPIHKESGDGTSSVITGIWKSFTLFQRLPYDPLDIPRRKSW